MPDGLDPLRLELEIDHDKPLEGSVSLPDGLTRSFAGWTGLASTLTAFLEDWLERSSEL